MIPIRLHDSNFTGDPSSSRYYAPERLTWLRAGPDTPVTFYTDLHLSSARNAAPGIFRVAWILEPSAINSAPYKHVVENIDSFDLVLTHHAEMLQHGPKFVYYPNGMSWIAAHDWKQHQKRENVSIIASAKKTSEGHLMRHEVIRRVCGSGANGINSINSKLDVYGRGYNPVDHKITALGPYRFSVVIENCSAPWYFTEKLLDCFATFTVPVYWGCPGIAKFFDTSGMCVVSSIEEITSSIDILARDGEAIYRQMAPAMAINHEKAKQYRVAEDWIFDNILTPRGLVDRMTGGALSAGSVFPTGGA